MKFKFTPLLIVSIALFLFGIYYAISGKGGNLGGLVIIILVFTAAISFLLYLGLRKIFGTRTGRQAITELLLISIVTFFYYKVNGKLVLHVPRNFQGYVLLVYGVENKSALPASGFLKANNDVAVPSSGIIFISGKRSKSIVATDSSDQEIKLIKAGYGFPIHWDTLKCRNKSYVLDILVFGQLSSSWNFKSDTINQALMKDKACKMLTE